MPAPSTTHAIRFAEPEPGVLGGELTSGPIGATPSASDLHEAQVLSSLPPRTTRGPKALRQCRG